MVGTGAVSTPTATLTETALVLVTVVKPDLDPATVTVRVLPSIAVDGVYVLAVAPVMATPFAFHWYLSVTGAGPHAPVAVRTEPTLTAPLITGTGALRVPTATLAVIADVLTAVV
jgi:hypothetical protein